MTDWELEQKLADVLPPTTWTRFSPTVVRKTGA